MRGAATTVAAGRLVGRLLLQLFGRCVHAQLKPQFGAATTVAAGRLVGRVRSLTFRAVPLRWASNRGMGAHGIDGIDVRLPNDLEKRLKKALKA